VRTATNFQLGAVIRPRVGETVEVPFGAGRRQVKVDVVGSEGFTGHDPADPTVRVSRRFDELWWPVRLPASPCEICGGTAGMRQLARHGLKSHNLCVARQKHGSPTPSLGDECPECLGVGCHPRSAVGPVNPNQADIEAWAPTCKPCKGSGVIGGAR
jgi:hypothetical protein